MYFDRNFDLYFEKLKLLNIFSTYIFMTTTQVFSCFIFIFFYFTIYYVSIYATIYKNL